MTQEDVKHWFDALSEGNVTPLTDRLTGDCVLEFPGSTFGGEFRGSRRVRVFLRQNQRLFDGGLRFTLHWVMVTDAAAVAQWTNAGRTKQGSPYANRGVTIFRRRGEKIERIEDYLDTEILARTWPGRGHSEPADDAPEPA